MGRRRRSLLGSKKKAPAASSSDTPKAPESPPQAPVEAANPEPVPPPAPEPGPPEHEPDRLAAEPATAPSEPLSEGPAPAPQDPPDESETQIDSPPLRREVDSDVPTLIEAQPDLPEDSKPEELFSSPAEEPEPPVEPALDEIPESPSWSEGAPGFSAPSRPPERLFGERNEPVGELREALDAAIERDKGAYTGLPSNSGEEDTSDPPTDPRNRVAMDRFFAQEFGDFDDEPPPTEEVPSPVLDDLSQVYDAPMNVPEPPPLPGILDRYTPAPVARTQVGQRHSEDRPSYLPTPLPAPDRGAERVPTPAQEPRAESPPAVAAPAPVQAADGWDPELDGPRPATPISPALVFVVGGMLLGLVIVLVFAFLLITALFTDNTVYDLKAPVQTPDPTPPSTVVVPEPDEPDEPEDPEDPDALDEPQVPDPEPEPAPAPRAQPVTQPAASPRPRPRPRPKPAPRAEQGILKIRCNRRVLVYVNGQPIGYAPQDYAVTSGSYTVEAMLPGSPDSKQSKTVSISEQGGTQSVQFSF